MQETLLVPQTLIAMQDNNCLKQLPKQCQEMMSGYAPLFSDSNVLQHHAGVDPAIYPLYSFLP